MIIAVFSIAQIATPDWMSCKRLRASGARVHAATAAHATAPNDAVLIE